MSHVVDLKIEILDLDSLLIAAKKLGLEWLDQRTFRWFGRFMNDSPIPKGFTANDYGKCLHAIGIPGNNQSYQVGVVRNPNGRGFTLLYDAWSGGLGLEAKIGKDASKLRQRYAAEVAIKNARRQGFRVTEQAGTDGKIKLVCRR